jgi:RimJ/RimL family protein N-acetyltransferase
VGLSLGAGQPVLETPRLVLRPPRGEDFDAWAEFAADPAATRFLGGPKPRALAWRSFLTMAGAWAIQGFGPFSVIEKSTGRWLGRVGPWRPDGWPGNEIGWAIVASAQGQGLACEAAVATIDWALATLGWQDIIHCIDDGNAASVALARRLGSVPRSRVLLPPPADVEVELWGQTRAAWLARRAGMATG